MVKLWYKLWNKNQTSLDHANIMGTWAVLVLPVVRPIGGYHCRLHPALRRDLPNLAPVQHDKPRTSGTSPQYIVAYCDYRILCSYNLILTNTGTLAPRSTFRIWCGATCFGKDFLHHALRFLARSCCVTCSSEKALGRESVSKKDCTFKHWRTSRQMRTQCFKFDWKECAVQGGYRDVLKLVQRSTAIIVCLSSEVTKTTGN